MEDTLKKLTDKIYNEGIAKANKEADEIINAAKAKADALIVDAKKQSEQIIAKANSDNVEQKKKVNAELEMTANQSLSAIKQNIVDVMLNSIIDKPIQEAFNDQSFIKQMITTMLSNWDFQKENTSLDILFPEGSKVDDFIDSSLSKSLSNKVKFYPTKEIKNGFSIVVENGGYKINFTEEDFSAFIKNYIRPRTFDLLFKK